MTDDAEDLARGEIDEESLARWFKAGRREDPQAHPSLEKISAYQAGELPPEEADTIQEHLVQCTFCTAIFQDLKGFLEAGQDQVQEGVADLGAETGWRKIRTEMGWTGKDPSEETSRLKKTLRRLRMLAAVLLVGVLGLSVYAWRLWQDLKAADDFVSAAPINHRGARGTPEEDAETLVTSPEDSIVFTLDGLRVSAAELRVEIHDSSGRTVWSRPSLKKREDYLAFRVPPDVLKPGLYTIRVFTKDGTAVGEYFVKIVLPL